MSVPLHAFLVANHAEILSRSRSKLGGRGVRTPSAAELTDGLPRFLDQLITILGAKGEPSAEQRSVAASATIHGADLLRQGLTVGQVVQDYGSICQSVTEVAAELHTSITAEEFQTFNRILDEAIAQAVTEYETDSLTGLANYRCFAQNLDREVERSRRYGQPLSLLTLDLDHMKAINDEHGHDAGDDAIKLIAKVITDAVRRFELVARQGGDEFAIILPDTGAFAARQLADRLHDAVRAQAVMGLRLSASIGLASWEDGDRAEHQVDASALLKASDEALYRAKRGGRNRVESDRTDHGR